MSLLSVLEEQCTFGALAQAELLNSVKCLWMTLSRLLVGAKEVPILQSEQIVVILKSGTLLTASKFGHCQAT